MPQLNPEKFAPHFRQGANKKTPNKYKNKSAEYQVNFKEINAAALAALPSLLNRLLPGGKIIGNEYIARNPRRSDNKPGLFKINMNTGRWADFATGDRGGDIISLAAYLGDIRQSDAASNIAEMLGVYHG